MSELIGPELRHFKLKTYGPTDTQAWVLACHEYVDPAEANTTLPYRLHEFWVKTHLMPPKK